MRLRRQIFRQIVQIERRRADARQAKFVQDDGKDASKRAAKALDVNCAVLPISSYKKSPASFLAGLFLKDRNSSIAHINNLLSFIQLYYITL